MEYDIQHSWYNDLDTGDVKHWVSVLYLNICCFPGTSYRNSIAKPKVTARASETSTCQNVGLIIQSALGSTMYWLFSARHDVRFWRNSFPCYAAPYRRYQWQPIPSWAYLHVWPDQPVRCDEFLVRPYDILSGSFRLQRIMRGESRNMHDNAEIQVVWW